MHLRGLHFFLCIPYDSQIQGLVGLGAKKAGEEAELCLPIPHTHALGFK